MPKKSQKEHSEIITVMRADGLLVSTPVSFFAMCSDKRKKLNQELTKRLAPNDKLIFIGCPKNEESSYLKEEYKRVLKFLSKNQKYSFYSTGNKEKNDQGVFCAPV